MSNRLAHHRLRSCNAGRFSTFRLPATLRRRLRVRLQRTIEQPELAAAPKGSEPGPSPTATAAIVITEGGRLSIRVVPRCTDPDEASHASLNELLAAHSIGGGQWDGLRAPLAVTTH